MEVEPSSKSEMEIDRQVPFVDDLLMKITHYHPVLHTFNMATNSKILPINPIKSSYKCNLTASAILFFILLCYEVPEHKNMREGVGNLDG